MQQRHRSSSPLALAAVVSLHVALLALLIQYQPKLKAAHADVLRVSLVTAPQPLPVEAPPAPPKAKASPPKKIQRAVTPPAAPSEASISLPPAPPAPAPLEPAPVVASALPAPAPAAPEPVVLPRFDADYLRNPAPAYPNVSRRLGEQGKVLVRVVVRPDGSPDSVTLRQSSGSARLDDAALDAVRKWRFVPARQGPTPVSAAVLVPIHFSLEG